MSDPNRRRSYEAARRALARSVAELGVPDEEEMERQLRALAAEGLVEIDESDPETIRVRLTDAGLRRAEQAIDRMNAEDN